MSKTVDEERAEDAERARLDRAILVLQELMTIVRARAEGLTVPLIASRIERGERTVYDREETLRWLLKKVGQTGARRPRRE